MKLLVYGFAVSGEALARAALDRGYDVVVADDRPTDAGRAIAAELAVSYVERPVGDQLAQLVGSVDEICPSPGMSERHEVFGAAFDQFVPIRTELDLAWDWDGQRPEGRRPMVAITGTDGKTTVTTLATEMINASGGRAVAAGNNEVPLVQALASDAEAFVVEASSFRLRFLTTFAPIAATWLNLAPDHLDWHGDLESYAAAKARIFEFQRPGDVAIGAIDDPIVMAWLDEARARHVTFGGPHHRAEYFERESVLHGPRGPIVSVDELWRAMPHDRTNALAAAATVLESGLATIDGVRTALRNFRGIAHRISLVTEANGVRFFDDSKATTPHAAITAIRAFEHVVLIAGGRNKDLDLRAMATEPTRVRAVVAMGEAADQIAAAFAGLCPVLRADSMAEAVRLAADAATPGDAVLLSPGCTSYDWYRNYGERGDDFAARVVALIGAR